MNFEFWKNLSNLTTAVGGGLAVLGTFGAYYFGNQLEKSNEVTERAEKKELLTKVDKLVEGNDALKISLKPFEELASKKFPGIPSGEALEKLSEEIKTVSEKTVRLQKQLEEANPVLQSIRSASATVEIIINSSEAFNNWFIDAGGFLALGKGNSAILLISGTQSNANQIGGGKVLFKGVWSIDASNEAIGKSIQSLLDAEYVQVMFVKLPENCTVIGGKAYVTLNGQTQLDFQLPSQIASGQNVLARGISKSLDPIRVMK